MKEDTVTEVTLGHFCHLVKDMCPKCQCTVALCRWRLHSQWLVRSGPRTMKPTNAVRQDAVSARSRNLSPQAHESLAEAPTICLTSPLLGGLSLSLLYRRISTSLLRTSDGTVTQIGLLFDPLPTSTDHSDHLKPNLWSSFGGSRPTASHCENQ